MLGFKGFIFNFFTNLSSQKDEGKVGGGFEDVGESWDGDVRVKQGRQAGVEEDDFLVKVGAVEDAIAGQNIDFFL